MYWKKLEYMLDNDADKTLTKKESDIRKKIRPTFINLLKLGNKLKLTIEKKEFQPQSQDRPIIYVACHGFKDDALNTLVTINDPSTYIVVGNIDLFFHTFDGLCLWIYGSQLVDRYNKKSKNAMKPKMEKMIDLGNNVIIYPEATWNLSPNHLMENLHGGFYDIALKKNALIVPVLTHKVGNKCYSRLLKEIDINDISLEDTKCMEQQLSNYITKAKDLNIYNDTIFIELKKKTELLFQKIELLKENSNLSERISMINEIERVASQIYSNKEKCNLEDEFKKSAYELIETYIHRIGMIKKEIMVKKVRDMMALEKYDMFKAHPDDSYMDEETDIYEAWDKYIQDTLKGTPYFYPEPERTCLYKDKLIKSEEEVMPKFEKNKQLILKKR